MAAGTEISVTHGIPRDDLALGLVRAEGVAVEAAAPALESALDGVIASCRGGLDAANELRRQAVRDILRNGKYKPTGRGKPANEYLLRATAEAFPRINGPVDANNLISLRYMLPISILDLDRAEADRFEFRLGGAEERYLFNPAGQLLELADLVCGCRIGPSGTTPIVTPIKDGMATKIVPATRRLAGVIYFPVKAGLELLEQANAELAGWLGGCGPQVVTSTAIARTGEVVTL